MKTKPIPNRRKAKPKTSTDRRTKAMLLEELNNLKYRYACLARDRDALEKEYYTKQRAHTESIVEFKKKIAQAESNFIAMQLSNDRLREDNAVLRAETAGMYHTARRLEIRVDELEAELAEYRAWDLAYAEVRVKPQPQRHD